MPPALIQVLLREASAAICAALTVASAAIRAASMAVEVAPVTSAATSPTPMVLILFKQDRSQATMALRSWVRLPPIESFPDWRGIYHR